MNIAEIIRQVPSTERRKLLFEVAKSVLDEQPYSTPVMIVEGDAPPIGYLFRVPPMPEPEPQTEEERRAQDARRFANLDDALTLDEMLAALDFTAAAAESPRS
jgi:hypothetical protein